MGEKLFSTPVSLLYVKKRFAIRLFDAVENGNSDEIQDCLNDCIADAISFMDGRTLEKRESFCHGMLLGMLNSNHGWQVLANREAGNGRADIIVEPVKKRKKLRCYH